MRNAHSVSSQWRNAWLIKNTGIFIKILIGHQVSYTWRSFREPVEVVSLSLSTLGTSSSGFTLCHVFMSKKERADGGMQENLVSRCELQRILSFLGSCRKFTAANKLPECVQGVASWPLCDSKCRLSLPFVVPGAETASKGLVLDAAFISPSCQSRFTPTLLLLLIMTIIMVWWQRCAEHLGRFWCWFPCREGSSAAQLFDVTFRYLEMIRHFQDHINSWV